MAPETGASNEQANREAKARLIPALEGRGAHLTFEEAVRDFPEGLINAKPEHVPYSFWHQIEHMRIAQRDILEYIIGESYTPPSWPDDYWPAQGATTDAAGFRQSISRLQADRQQLIDLIQDPSCDVLAPVDHMEGRSIFREALLVIDHTAYHVGEFVIARQVMGAWESSLTS
jgi:hypothetical protein